MHENHQNKCLVCGRVFWSPFELLTHARHYHAVKKEIGYKPQGGYGRVVA